MVVDEIDLNRLESVLTVVLARLSEAEHTRLVDRLARVIFRLPDIDQYEKVLVASRILSYGATDPVGMTVEYLMKVLLRDA